MAGRANPEAPRAPRAAVVLTLALVGVFAFLQVYSVQSILPELQRDLGASVVEIGNAVGVTILAVALLSPFVGMLSDALGRKWLVVTSVFALALPTALMPLVQTTHGLLVLRFLQGLAVPGVTVVTMAYIGEEFRGGAMMRVMTLYITGNVVGGFLGRFLLGHLTDLMAWRAAFAVMAALNVAGGVLVWRMLPASRHFVANRRAGEALRTLGRLLHDRAVLAPCALGFTVLFAQIGLLTFVNLHLAAPPYGFSPADLANVFAVYLLGIVVTPLAGRLMPHLGLRTVMLGAVLLAVAGVATTLVAPASGIIAGLAVASCGTFITQSANTSFLAAHVQQGRSLANGLYYTAYYGGGFVGAWACGLAYSHGGWPATVMLIMGVQALGWFMAWRFVR